jgi:hypothetical protein
MTVQFPLVGNLFVAEIILLIAAAVGVQSWLRTSLHQSIVVIRLAMLGVVMVISYSLTDLIVGNSVENQMRGFARCAFLVSDILGIWYLVRRQTSRLQLLVSAYAVAQIVATAVHDEGSSFVSTWKFGYSLPVTILLLTCIPQITRLLGTPIANGLLLALSVIHVYLDYRSLSGICLITWGIVAFRYLRRRRNHIAYLVLGTMAGSAAFAFFGYVYSSTHNDFSARREAANAARLAGIYAATDAIISSPLIGHGSWAYGDLFGTSFDRFYAELTGKRYFEVAGYQEFGAHSQLLQAWYEGGAAAAVFFLYLFSRLLSAVGFSVTRPDEDPGGPLKVLLVLLALWNLLFSPFAGEHRFWIAAVVVVLGLLRDDVVALRRASSFGRSDLTHLRAVALGMSK